MKYNKHTLVMIALIIACFTIFSACTTNASQSAVSNQTAAYQAVKLSSVSADGFSPLNMDNLDRSKINIVLNGKQLEFDVQPIMDSGRILVPVRSIFEAVGMTIKWDVNTQTITASSDTNKIIMKIGAMKLSVNGADVSLDVPAKVISGRTMVPLRAITEGLGMSADWNNTASVVFLNSANISIYYSDGKLEYYGQRSSDGKRNGFGKEYSESGELIYVGQWVGDVRSGIGKFTWKDTGTYEGEFADGQPNGYGVFTHPGVGTYYGNYLDGKRSGNGMFIWLDGDKYAGGWLNDMMNGAGTYTYADGTISSGQWSNNKFLG